MLSPVPSLAKGRPCGQAPPTAQPAPGSRGSPLRGLLTGPRGDPCRGDECGVVTDGVFPLSQNLFSAFTITSVQEMSLGADLPLNAISRLVWTPTTGTGGGVPGGPGGAVSLPSPLSSPPRSSPAPASPQAGPKPGHTAAHGDQNLPGHGPVQRAWRWLSRTVSSPSSAGGALPTPCHPQVY